MKSGGARRGPSRSLSLSTTTRTKTKMKLSTTWGMGLGLGLALGPGLLLTGCADTAPDNDSPSASGESTLTVLAAASLTGTFTELAVDFEAAHPGVTVDLAFDSSATLAQQVVDGAPGDVLATADDTTMTTAANGGALDGGPEEFATNTVVLVVPADNPAGLASFGELDTAGVTYVVCVDTAPCGVAAAALLKQQAIAAPPASLEVDVKAVLAKVVTDEADAGIVYATDAVAAGDAVESFDIPGAEDRPNSYPIAALQQAESPELAAEFLDLVRSEGGQAVLRKAGFGPPAPTGG